MQASGGKLSDGLQPVLKKLTTPVLSLDGLSRERVKLAGSLDQGASGLTDLRETAIADLFGELLGQLTLQWGKLLDQVAASHFQSDCDQFAMRLLNSSLDSQKLRIAALFPPLKRAAGGQQPILHIGVQVTCNFVCSHIASLPVRTDQVIGR